MTEFVQRFWALLRRHWAWWLVPMLLVLLFLGLLLLWLPPPDAAPPFRYGARAIGRSVTSRAAICAANSWRYAAGGCTS